MSFIQYWTVFICIHVESECESVDGKCQVGNCYMNKWKEVNYWFLVFSEKVQISYVYVNYNYSTWSLKLTSNYDTCMYKITTPPIFLDLLCFCPKPINWNIYNIFRNLIAYNIYFICFIHKFWTKHGNIIYMYLILFRLLFYVCIIYDRKIIDGKMMKLNLILKANRPIHIHEC